MAFQNGANLYTQGFGSRPESVEIPHLDVRAPTTTDILYPVGKRWIFVNTAAYELIGLTSSLGVTSATWVQVADADGPIQTILGTTNQVTVTTASGTSTVSLPNTIVTPGSLTTTTTLSSSGATTLATTGASVNTFGNATGATSVNIINGTGASGWTSTNGDLTINSGTGTLGIGTDATAQTINLGTGLASKTVTLGSTSGSSPVNISCGTGGMVISTSGPPHNTQIGSGLGGSNTILQAGSGNINLNCGNGTVICNTNFQLDSAGTQLQIHGGAATDFIGSATLTAGTSGAIANTNIAAGDRIFIQRIAANASTTLGELSYTISAGASFTITSLIIGTPGSPETGDASTVGYFIVRQV